MAEGANPGRATSSPTVMQPPEILLDLKSTSTCSIFDVVETSIQRRANMNIQQDHFNWFFTVSVFTAILAAVVVNGTSSRAHGQCATRIVKDDSRTAADQSGFYCNLKALSPAERAQHHQLTERFKAARVETNELADGYAFRFQAGQVSISDLATWVSWEQKCCPFLDFEIELQRDRGPLWLKLRGREGVKEFMRHEFGME
jgi:hypothetical protein